MLIFYLPHSLSHYSVTTLSLSINSLIYSIYHFYRLNKHETKLTKANKKIEAENEKYNEKLKAIRDKIYRKYTKSDYEVVLNDFNNLKEKISRLLAQSTILLISYSLTHSITHSLTHLTNTLIT